MAQARFRSASVFLNGRKWGQIEGVKYDYTTGDEAQFGDPGYLGHSDGAGTTQITCNGIIPVTGQDVDVYSAMQQRLNFELDLAPVNGKIHHITVRCTKANATGSQKAGTLMGEFDFAGGEPVIT